MTCIYYFSDLKSSLPADSTTKDEFMLQKRVDRNWKTGKFKAFDIFRHQYYKTF